VITAEHVHSQGQDSRCKERTYVNNPQHFRKIAQIVREVVFVLISRGNVMIDRQRSSMASFYRTFGAQKMVSCRGAILQLGIWPPLLKSNCASVKLRHGPVSRVQRSVRKGMMRIWNPNAQ
jgi:hypothetical protein